MKLNIGFCRKIGLPEYSSAGANCNVEIDVPDVLLIGPDRDAFAAQVRAAFDACRTAVDAELAELGAGPAPEPAPAAPAANGNGSGYAGRNGGGRPNGNGDGYNNGSRSNGGGQWGPTNGNGNGRSNGTATAPAVERRSLPPGCPEKLPRNGMQLLGWMSAIAENTGTDYMRTIGAWGPNVGIRGPIKSWNEQQVGWAIDEIAVRMKSGPDRPAGRPNGSNN